MMSQEYKWVVLRRRKRGREREDREEESREQMEESCKNYTIQKFGELGKQ
jgi:hypothetical protein